MQALRVLNFEKYIRLLILHILIIYKCVITVFLNVYLLLISYLKQGFDRQKHVGFILGLDKKTDTFEYHVTEHLRMSGIYWGATCMALLGELGKMDKDSIIKFIGACKHKNGGYSGNINHDPHLLYTLSAVQILALFGELDNGLDKELVSEYVAGLQQEDGSFVGDKWGEVDTRFSYCALNCLALLGKLDKINVKKATDFVSKCRNFDGGYGAVPGAESHAGQIFCCVAALAIGGAVDEIDKNLLGWWLCERQLPCGGLNGRPEKKEDVCYSWWVLSALSILGKVGFLGYHVKSLRSLSCAVRIIRTAVYLIDQKICQMYFTHSLEWLPSLFSDIQPSKKWIQYLPFLLKLFKSSELKNYIHHRIVLAIP
eukprot:jgi/Bigna1/54462/estExt_Genewise1Plus.C_350005